MENAAKAHFNCNVTCAVTKGTVQVLSSIVP